MENEKLDEAILLYQEAIQNFLGAGELEDSRYVILDVILETMHCIHFTIAL